jgi:Undecaprenyl-phosphate galactose phosphotransferase WbaP
MYSLLQYMIKRNVALGSRRKGRYFNHLLRGYMLIDFIAMPCGLFIAWVLTAMLNQVFLWYPQIHSGPFMSVTKISELFVISTGIILWFQHTGHYRLRLPFWMEARNITITMLFAMLVDSFLQFSTKQDFSRFCLVTGWLIAGVGIIVMRAVLRKYFKRIGVWKIRTLIVGQGATADDTLRALRTEPGLGYDVVAQIADLPSAFSQAGESWEALCSACETDYIIIALDGVDWVNAQQAIAQLPRERIPFSVSASLFSLPVLGMTPQHFPNHDVVLFTRTSGLEQPLSRFIKRASDVLISGTVLVALSPIFIALIAMVRRDGGAAFFGHSRIGKNGKTFKCLKFRSMVANGDVVLKKYLEQNPQARSEWHETQKLKNDPRVTSLGEFMRKSSLDELPQLINVLKGDMSLVGPRPIVTGEVERYDSDIAYYYKVRPGITGLWQISGRNNVSYEQRVQMDSWYVRNWSLWYDIAIICKTFPALLKREGAY